MRSLQEGSLLKKGFLYFMLPSFCLAILSIWFPFIYAIVPADESLDCFCSLLDNFPHWKNRISAYNYVDTDYEIVPDFYMILNMIIFTLGTGLSLWLIHICFIKLDILVTNLICLSKLAL